MTALDLDRIREAVADDFAVIEYTESTGSTNTDLMQADKVADGTVLLPMSNSLARAAWAVTGSARPAPSSFSLCSFSRNHLTTWARCRWLPV